MEIKAREKLRARRNKEHGKKEYGRKKMKLEGREMWKEKGAKSKGQGGGRKAPCVSKNEAKYKVK